MIYIGKNGVKLSDRLKTLYSCPKNLKGEYVIPNRVTNIGFKAFERCSGLTRIEIPNSVTSIGAYAFLECTGLTSVTIPDSVTSIGNGAFNRCTGMTSIEIPNSVTSIGDSAFFNCKNLTSITLPSSITSIGESAFKQCDKLTYVVIPDSVIIIGVSAFSRCRSINSIVIPNCVTSIGDWAFAGGKNLTSITIPNSVTSIGKDAFRYCIILASIIIPNNVVSIGDGAFRDCINLTSITIPNSVTSIGDDTFWGCKKLTSITIPNSVTSIGCGAFLGCSNLQEIIVPKGQKARFARMAGLKDLKDKIVEASMEDQKLRTWEEVNAEYRAYFERRQKENPNIQNKNGGTPLEFPPFGVELSLQEYSQFKKEGRTIHSWMFWCKSGNEIHELARLYGPIGGIGLYTPRKGYYKVVGIEGEGIDARLVCYYNLFSSNEFLEEEDEKVRVKQKPLFNKRSSCAGPIEIGDIVHVKSTELVEDIYDGRTYQAYKIIWEFV